MSSCLCLMTGIAGLRRRERQFETSVVAEFLETVVQKVLNILLLFRVVAVSRVLEHLFLLVFALRYFAFLCCVLLAEQGLRLVYVIHCSIQQLVSIAV